MKNQPQYPHWPFPVVGKVSPQTKKMISSSTNVKAAVESILKLRRKKNKELFDTDALL